MECCMLCPRKCLVDRRADSRSLNAGVCGQSDKIKIARAALHYWEEPCISGKNGSGAVFFSGCSLKCVFCQNRDISAGGFGKEISIERLADIFLELQEKGAENINLVTPTHFIPQIRAALDMVRADLKLPVVYNSSGYESVESLKLLAGYIDIYLPDFKYADKGLAAELSRTGDYPERAIQSIDEMVRQVTEIHKSGGSHTEDICSFDDRGMMRHGVIIRHLVLPGHVHNSKDVLNLLYERYNNRLYYSIMNQYTPPADESVLDVLVREHPELTRKITKREYEKVIDYALSLGITRAYIQEGDTASESFIPMFDLEGV
ncbi:MAG: radical SAM protein [Lachnospiraceae bacterium]|nr:radical SAM protein [Lachnospiraceae bacterium]